MKKRQPLSVVSNSHVPEKRTLSGRTRKAPKRFVEDDDTNTKENIENKNKVNFLSSVI